MKHFLGVIFQKLLWTFPAVFFVFLFSTANAQNVSSEAEAKARPFMFFLYQIFSNTYISSFLAGIIFASLIYVLFLVKKPNHLYSVLFKSSPEAFAHVAERDPNGTFQESYSSFRNRFKLIRGAFFGALLTLLIQVLAFVILSLIVFQAATQEDIDASSKTSFFSTTPADAAQRLAGGAGCEPGSFVSRACGQCGTQKRVCTSEGEWSEYGVCSDEGVCKAGAREATACKDSPSAQSTRVCSSSCAWEVVTACPVSDKPEDVSALLVLTINGRLVSEHETIEMFADEPLLIEGGDHFFSHAILGTIPGYHIRTIFADSEGSWTASFPPKTFVPGLYELTPIILAQGDGRIASGQYQINVLERPVAGREVQEEVSPKPEPLYPAPREQDVADERVSWFTSVNTFFVQHPWIRLIALVVGIFLLLIQIFFAVLSSKKGDFILFFRSSKKKNLSSLNNTASGCVYDFLTKLPLSGAEISLLDSASKKKIQTQTTDADGRYLFSVKPGRYVLSVKKKDFLFPSVLSEALSYDEPYSDLYHGEIIEIMNYEDTIDFDLPLDPDKKPHLDSAIVRVAKFRDRFPGVSLFACLASCLVSVALWSVFAPLQIIIHVWCVVFSRRLRRQYALDVSKPVGIIEDDSGKRLSYAVVRAFDAKHKKLVGEWHANREGLCLMELGPNVYDLVVTHPGFAQEQIIAFYVASFEKSVDFGTVRMRPRTATKSSK